MTEEDQDAALGRMVTRFSAAKKRRAVLFSEAQAVGLAHDEVAKTLRGLSFVTAFSDGNDSGYSKNKADVGPLAPYASAEMVNALIDELRTVSSEIRTLRANLKAAGLQVE